MCALVVSCSCGSGEGAAKSGGGGVLAAAADSPQVFSDVGTFELVERSGSKVRREDLLGRPWVASFVFTRCTGPCPKVVGTLKKLQSRLEDGGARIVTISVDPQWDSPEVLRRYAADAGADPQRWLFLTGNEKAIQALIAESFLSAVERAPVGEAPIGQQVSHSTRLVAVDKKGRVRGFYAGESDEDVDLLVERLAFLQGERD
jgi:cytochrome oxidase Cu insertion factor (SCO1/SenC/PrrC family)